MARGGIAMLTNRAAEIISASSNIEVLYDQKPVWIETVNKETGTATVVVLGSKEKLEVPVRDLQETGVSEPFLH
jgi:H-type small acid-soluble spore protein